jgi:hypothetical protein
MNAKKAKTTFSFNVFLASVAAEPLEITYKEIAVILNISESTLSKLRHSRTKKMPANLHPGLMASKFAADIVKEFAPTRSTALLFAEYARLLGDRYIISDSLARFAALVAAGGPMDEDRARKLFAGMIPELLKLCYEEAYANSEQEYANWVMNHSDLQSEAVYQKLCDTINQDVLSSEQLKQLLNVVYAAGVRHQLAHYHSDFSYLEMMNDFFRSQVNQPFYSSIRRSERISISDDSTEMVRMVSAREQIVPQTLHPVDFTLTQTFYYSLRMLPEEVAKTAFDGLSCTVNGQPLLKYINQHENTAYTSPHQFITVTQTEGSGNEAAATHLTLRFLLYPAEAGEPFNIEYEYSCTMPFINNISCNYCYTLQYPCKFLDHEISLDERTRPRWGLRVKLFAPVTNGVYDREHQSDSAKISGTADSRHVMFYDWALPGAGYFRNLYELNSVENRPSP